MNILVTGGCGFIGSHIVDTYIENGHTVIILDDLSTGTIKNLNKKAIFYNMCINDDLTDIFKNNKIDIVNHHAAQIDVRKSVIDPLYDANINIIGTLNILQNCIKYNIIKFIFPSSGGAIYGEQLSFPATEDHPTKPISPYGISKLCIENYIYFYKLIYGLDYTILRYANVYGPRQGQCGEGGVISIFLNKFVKGESPIINGDGEQTRDFVYVKDVALANLLAINNMCNVVNISTAVETSINNLFYKINSKFNNNFFAKYNISNQGETSRSVISFEKAKKLLGWKPRVQLEDGLLEIIKYNNTNIL